MIKIGVDGRLLHGNLTGVGKYVLNIINYICRRDSEVQFRVYTNKNVDDIFERCEQVVIINDKPAFGKIKPMVWSKFLSHRLINKDEIDIYLSGDTFIPLFLKAKKIVSVVHDVTHLIAPETMSKLHLLTTQVFFARDIKRANALIANSNGTAEKIKQYFKKEADLVIYPIIDSWYRRIDNTEVQKRLAEINITFPFILSVATQEPRKNLDKTINAFLALKQQGELKEYKLLLVGSKGWRSEHIQSLIDANTADIISFGYVQDELLPYLYNGASLFVFPSKYEGFGMPAREAMLCGTNVVASDMPELSEATFDKGFYVNPEDSHAFQQKILEALVSPAPTVGVTSKDDLNNTVPFLRRVINS